MIDSFNECRGDAKKTWKLLRELWPSKSTSTKLNKIGDATNSLDVANSLNDCFVNVGPNFSAAIHSNMEHTVNENQDITSFRFREITFEEVDKLLRGLLPSKSCGVDGITARLIKAFGDAVIAPLLHIFNLSLTTSCFPDIWKVARVSALYKDATPQIASNYRPISVLPI